MLFEREQSGGISPYWGFYDISGVLIGYKNTGNTDNNNTDNNNIIILDITDINNAMIYLSNEDISSVTGNQYGFSVTTDENNRFDLSGVFNQPLFGVFKDTYYFIRDNNIYDAVYKWRYDRFDALALYGPISTWTIDGVTDMSGLFKNYEDFNEDLSGWNVSSVTNMSEMFKGAISFDQPIGTWNVSKVTNMSEMFNGTILFNQSLYNWSIDISHVDGFNPSKNNVITTNMLSNTNALKFYILSGDVSNDNLYDAVTLHQNNSIEYNLFYKPIDQWNTSSIVDMSGLFQEYAIFNEDLSDWDTSKVTNMSSMFKDASAFNKDISGWVVDNVSNMNYMFDGASSFDQPIGIWNVDNVVTMKSMFNDSTSFNQSLYNWPIKFTDVSDFDPYSSSINVTSMLNNTSSLQFQILTGSVDQDSIYYAFSILDTDLYSKNFRPIIEWDTILVNDISGLFKDTMFNQDISGWNVSNVSNMESLFENNQAFNQSLNNWNTSNVTSMNSMFLGAINFNQSLENWNTSNVTSMNSMFLGAIRFNSRVNNWNVSNIIDSSGAFMNAFRFSQDIYNWKMSRCINFTNMFNGCISLQASNLTLDVSTNFEINNDFYMQLLID